MIKNYDNWLNEGYYDPPEDEERFVEKHEDIVLAMEEKMKKEGVDIDPETFWENLQNLGIEDNFWSLIDEFISDNYQKTYIGNYNYDMDDQEFTKEYRKMYDIARDEAEKKFPSVKQLPGPSGTVTRPGKTIDFYKKRKKFIEEKSYIYIIEKFWKDYKAIYQKYIDIVHSKRGTLQGKKYGI